MLAAIAVRVGQASPQAVVLKIRRRKFQRTPQKGEIVITRRLVPQPGRASTC